MSLYVDGFLVIGSNEELMIKVKHEMESEFEKTDLGLKTYFLGMKIRYQGDQVIARQAKYAK